VLPQAGLGVVWLPTNERVATHPHKTPSTSTFRVVSTHKAIAMATRRATIATTNNRREQGVGIGAELLITLSRLGPMLNGRVPAHCSAPLPIGQPRIRTIALCRDLAQRDLCMKCTEIAQASGSLIVAAAVAVLVMYGHLVRWRACPSCVPSTGPGSQPVKICTGMRTQNAHSRPVDGW
jgi:hypothetical protein